MYAMQRCERNYLVLSVNNTNRRKHFRTLSRCNYSDDVCDVPIRKRPSKTREYHLIFAVEVLVNKTPRKAETLTLSEAGIVVMFQNSIVLRHNLSESLQRWEHYA